MTNDIGGERVVGIRYARLDLDDDRPEKAGREKPGSKRPGRVLADWAAAVAQRL